MLMNDVEEKKHYWGKIDAKQARWDRKRAKEIGRNEMEQITFQGQGRLTKLIILEGKINHWFKSNRMQ